MFAVEKKVVSVTKQNEVELIESSFLKVSLNARKKYYKFTSLTHQWFHLSVNAYQLFRRCKWETFHKSPKSFVPEEFCWQARWSSSGLSSSLWEVIQAVKTPRRYNSTGIHERCCIFGRIITNFPTMHHANIALTVLVTVCYMAWYK